MAHSDISYFKFRILKHFCFFFTFSHILALMTLSAFFTNHLERYFSHIFKKNKNKNKKNKTKKNKKDLFDSNQIKFPLLAIFDFHDNNKKLANS